MSAGPAVSITSLDLRFEPSPWRFEQERGAEIDAHFAKVQAEKPEVWNGRILLMHRWAVSGAALSGAYTEVNFASLLAWRDFGFADRTMFNCFGMAALRSADGAYLLGEMAPTTANAGRIYFPAGTPELADVTDGKVDLMANVLRELAEETGVAAGEVEIADHWTFIPSGQRLALMLELKAREDAQTLRERIIAHFPNDPHQELSDIHIVRSLADVDEARMPPWIGAYFRHIWA
jgi:8-oxo-dGTP pyrophosphatase MutT (NUDIX family)